MKDEAVTRGVFVAVLLLAAAGAQSKTLNGFDLSGASIPLREIVSGGPPRDGIPAINDPKFVAAGEAEFLRDDDRILGVTINGLAKAYPIAILDWHEVVNDRNGAQNFVVTYCPLCGTGMVFAANAGEGALLFGVSGLLYNSDVLLFDRQTESLWSQIMGEAVSGPLKGTALPQLPAAHTTWADWRRRHPDTLVLSTETGYRRDYTRSPYRGYERSPRLYFDVSNRAPRDYHPKALVMGVEVGGLRKVYPFDELRARGDVRFEDIIGQHPVVVHWNEAAGSAYVEDPDGRELPSTMAYWFAWYAFYPESEVFKAGE